MTAPRDQPARVRASLTCDAGKDVGGPLHSHPTDLERAEADIARLTLERDCAREGHAAALDAYMQATGRPEWRGEQAA